MQINHNLAALNTYNRLNSATNAQSKSLEKLSSGQRINKAGDDAAGLAISEKMRSQIKGLDQAGRNAQDGISMIQTAEGALTETHSILQRMRELAVQAGNDTNTTDDRGQIQSEVNQLSSEINRIAGNTEFNKQKLLDGAHAEDTVGGFSKSAARIGSEQVQAVYSFEIDCFATGCEIHVKADGVSTAVVVNTTACTLAGRVADMASAINNNTTTGVCWTATSVGNKIILTSRSASGVCADVHNNCINVLISCVAANTTAQICTGVQSVQEVCAITAAVRFSISDSTMKEGVRIDVAGSQYALWDSTKGNYTSCSDFMTKNSLNACVIVFDISNVDFNSASELMTCLAALTLSNGSTWKYDSTNKQICIESICAGAVSNQFANVNVYGMANSDSSKGNGTTLQIGANVNQTFTAFFGNMTGKAINVTTETGGTSITTKDGSTAYFTAVQNITNKDGKTTEYALDVSSAAKATAAVSALDDAISSVSTERAKLGAYQNRLEHTIANLSTSSENLTAAESRIRDVDMAKEMMEFNKNNILNQAATAMLAQANQGPQGVLQLLR